MKVPFVIAIVLMAGMAGCIGKKNDDVVEQADSGIIDDSTRDRIASRAAAVPRSYEFPDQEMFPSKMVYLNGTVKTSANTAYEDRNDRGGNSYNKVYDVFDLSEHVPVNQPVELSITSYFEGQPGSSADLDIYVNVPGTHTDLALDNNDEHNWKFSVQRMTVNTIRLASQPFEVGVQMSNGRAASEFPYTLRIEMAFAKDVVTPVVPWGFKLPADASGIVLTSEKAGGDDHVRSKFFVLDAEDNIVQFVDFNDLAIPTESVYVPLRGGAEYVVYAAEMHGGFLRMEADAPVPDRLVTSMAFTEERVVMSNSPTPGVGDRDWMHDSLLNTPQTGGESLKWTPNGFPLSIVPFIGSGSGMTTVAWGEIVITSSKGDVAWLQRVARHDDERGSLGYTQDHWNSGQVIENLARGDHDVWVADISPGVEIGFIVKTLAR